MSATVARTTFGAPVSTSAAVAAAAAASAALRYQFTDGITASLVVSVALLPVWCASLREYRLGRTIILMGALAAIWGAWLSFTEQSRAVSLNLMQGQSLNFISFVGSIGLLLWCRSQIGIRQTAIWFGFGALANVALTGISEGNPWKYTLAFPVAVTLLAIVTLARSRALEIFVLLALASVSLVFDSRSMTAFLLLTATIVAWQMLRPNAQRTLRPWQILLLLVALVISAYNLFQALMLEGMLGEYAQQRTQAQIGASGSLITGARPELGASVALITARPWGYGSGTIPSFVDIWTAKSGMNALNYDPNNGYVERYMFGGQFEVHSVLGDLWIRFGPLGALFTLLLLGSAVYAVARGVSRRSAMSVVVLLLLLVAWDTFFSPVLPSFRASALLFALTALPIPDVGREPKVRALGTNKLRCESARGTREPEV